MKPNVTAAIHPIVEDDDAEFLPIGNSGSVLYLRSDRSAPNRKVLAIDLTHPEPSRWKTVVPERGEAIEQVGLIGGRLVAQYLEDVQSRVLLFGLDGAAEGEVVLPGTGSVGALSGRQDVAEIFYSFTSPLVSDDGVPITILRAA